MTTTNVSELDFSTSTPVTPAAAPEGAESLDFGATPTTNSAAPAPSSATSNAIVLLQKHQQNQDWDAGLALIKATHVKRTDAQDSTWRFFCKSFRAAAKKAAAQQPVFVALGADPIWADAPETPICGEAPYPGQKPAPKAATSAPKTTATAVPEIIRERMHAARKASSQHYGFKNGFKLDVSEETVAQYGRAVAMMVDTSWHSLGAWVAGEPASDAVKAAAKEFNFGLPNVAGIVKARFVRKGSRIIAACMQANESGVIEPVVYEREENNGWKLHPISADKKITKYHILSMLLSGVKVMFVRNGRVVSPMLKLAEECAAREMWSQSGMDWKKYPGKVSLEATQKPTPTPAPQKPATNVIPLDAA